MRRKQRMDFLFFPSKEEEEDDAEECWTLSLFPGSSSPTSSFPLYWPEAVAAENERMAFLPDTKALTKAKTF